MGNPRKFDEQATPGGPQDRPATRLTGRYIGFISPMGACDSHVRRKPSTGGRAAFGEVGRSIHRR